MVFIIYIKIIQHYLITIINSFYDLRFIDMKIPIYPLISYLTRFTWKLRCENKNGGRAGDLTGCVTILLFSCVLLEQVLTCHTKLARRRSPEALCLFLASCNSNIPRNDMSICMTPIFAYFEACAKNGTAKSLYSNNSILPYATQFRFHVILSEKQCLI